MRAPVTFLALVLIVTTAVSFRSHGNALPPEMQQQETAAPAPSDTGSPVPVPRPITGRGPIVVWTSQLPNDDIGVYGFDLDALNSGGQPVLLGVTQVLGNVINGPVGPRGPVDKLPFLINTNGVNKLLQVTRQGITSLDSGIGFPQVPNTILTSRDGKRLALLVNGARGLTLHIQNIETGTTQDVLVKVPTGLTSTAFTPSLIAWYDHYRRFLLMSLNFATGAPVYSLTLDGKVTLLPWLNDLSIGAGTMLADQESFLFGGGNALRFASARKSSIRVLARLHENDFEGPLVSPDGSRVAYASGTEIKVARVTDGHVLLNGHIEPPVGLTPLEWIDGSRLLVLAQSMDFATNQPSEGLLLFDSQGAQSSPRTVFMEPFAGAQVLNFIGVLR